MTQTRSITKPQQILRGFCPLLVSLFLLLPPMQGYATNVLSRQQVADALTDHALDNRFPNTLDFNMTGLDSPLKGNIRYTFDPEAHQEMADVYLRYQPDYACFVAMDADTGAILNVSSFIKSAESWDNLVMRSEYPAASVFKVITAAAGIDLGKVSESTVIPYNGKSTTLYKSQVLRHKENKWTRTPTFRESFAKSVNPVFGQVGVFQLGAGQLTNYAERFGFNAPLATDINLPVSRLGIEFDGQWPIAEAASGYTRDITLSPIHAAQIAATVINGGYQVTPHMVDSVRDSKGNVMYQAKPKKGEQIIQTGTAKQLKNLMHATTRIGSARSSFRDTHKYKVYRNMDIGGKTGSLTGYSPKGRHDWFVGYAEKDGKRIAYASLIINKEKWYVRSAYVARQFIYHYFTRADAKLAQATADLALSE